MKKMSSRLISLVLILALVLSLVPAISVPAKAAYVPTTNQQNIVDWANYLYNLTWVAQETIYGWRYGYTFEKGESYRLPYAQPINAGAYIGYGVSIETFLAAAADASSVYYSKMSEYNGWYSTYYGTDCSAFVSLCWGTSRKTTYTIPSVSTNYGYATESNIRSYLQLGDALNSNDAGHVVLVTDLTFDDSGSLTQIEITEQTPPQLKRSYYTPTELAAKYGAQYTIQRYTGTVPEAPESGYVSQCTAYAAHCTVQITADTSVMSLPCSSMVDDSSAMLQTAAAGGSWTATGLYQNTAGELWYQVTTESGEEGYVLASDTVYVDEHIDDITITGAAVPNGHVVGNIFYVQGVISSKYNKLTTAAVYIYKGFGRSGTPVTGYSDSVSGNYYSLMYSNIDNNTAFNQVGLGKNTYVISADYVNYYVQDGSVKSNTGTVYLVEEYFMAISSSVSQSTCAHSYSDTTMVEPTCTQSGSVVHACSTCGYVYTETVTGGHAYGEWTVTEATCVADGSRSRTCATCGDVQTEVLAAGGHSYESKTIEVDCQTPIRTEFTCSLCGDYYYEEATQMTGWQEAKPDVDESLIESKTQYRYSVLETVTSPSDALDGYELIGSDWVQVSGDTILYVNSWPAGFSTGSEIYAQYNNIGSKVTASETETSKTVINSDAVAGYLYYHWCYTNSYTSTSYKTGSYATFHAYYSTTNPSSYRVDTSDWSYCTADACCSNSQWFFVATVYGQNYSVYEKQYIHQRWSDWSDWSDTEAVESETCTVETRTLYRYEQTAYGDHSYESVTTEATCTQDGSIVHTCTLCGDSYSEVLAAPGHSYESEITEATCTQDGSAVHTCTLCGDSYTEVLAAPGHSYESVMTEATCTQDGSAVHTCTLCGDSYTEVLVSMGHYWSNGVCGICGEMKVYYLFGYINGANYACEEDSANMGDYRFVDGTLVATFTEASYVAVKETDNANWYMTNGWLGTDVTSATLYNTNDGIEANKLYVPGNVEVTFTLVENEDGTLTLSYVAAQPECAHSYEGVTTEPTCAEDGVITYTCANCGDSYTETIPATGHSYNAEVTAPTCTESGYTTYSCPACGDSYVADETAALDHSYNAEVTAPTCTEGGHTTYSCSACGDSYVADETAALGHSYEGVTTEPTCAEDGLSPYTCANCRDSYTETIPATGHSYNAEVTAPTCTEGGHTTYSCSACGDSYVADENAALGHSYEGVVTAPTCSGSGYTTYSCTACGDTYTEIIAATGHSYVDGNCTTCGAADPDYVKPVTVPTLMLVAPTLNFEDEIYYNIYYTSSDMTDVVEMGLVTFESYLVDGTVDDALEIIPGYVTSGSNYMSHTNGIPAKMLSDTVFFRVYAKLSDGTYTYSQTAGYHAVAYAKDILANSTSQKMKSLVVAMLNYGAAAQVHFDYKTDALMNAFLTEEQKALVSEYSSDMVDSIVAADSSKTGNFKAVSGGYSALAPNVVFEGAFSINYYFTPAKAMDGQLKLYYWKLDDYNAADVLTTENATGVVVMEETSVAGQYLGAVPEIAAKQIDQTVYVCGVYESGGVSYNTGVIAYSLAAYCLDRIANGTETMQAFATETVVYGYYAKAYFA